MKFKIGQVVAFDMNCPCGDIDCDGGEQGYYLHTITGEETKEELDRCYLFSKETMEKLK